MATQLHDTGEEAILRDFFEESLSSKSTSVSLSLYNDSVDAFIDSNDTEDITTEPAGSAFTRSTKSFGTGDFTAEDNTNDNWQVVITDATFDTSDSTQDVDAYVVILSFLSQDKGDTSAREHILFTGNLDQTYDLNSIDSFTLSGAGLEIN